ncbi:MAG: integrin alpha, partial [Anaerolineales bacterium]
MTGYKYLSVILTLSLLLASPAGPVRASTLPNAEPASPETTLPETLQGIPEATDGWWAAVQEDIRQSEYHITWQEHIYLADLPATSASLGAGAYQAPNRAHNLRTYFAPAGVRLIPRVFEGETPPWEWGLTLTGFGYTGDVQPVTAAIQQVDENRIEYQRGDPSAGSGQALTEWYVNDERGLEQGFTLPTAPYSTIRNPQSEIVLDLALSGNLTAALGGGGQTIEFSTAPSTGSGQNGGVRVLSYGELVVYDAAGQQLPSRLSLSPGGEGRGEGGIRITFDATGALYPITIDPLATSPNWTAESDQVNANFGYSVRTAGDVNGDGYSDVIVGAPLYDGGHDNEGRAYVYHGSPTGLATSHNWTAESDQADARFGYSVGTAGDVNGDGYSDVIVGAPYYDNDES